MASLCVQPKMLRIRLSAIVVSKYVINVAQLIIRMNATIIEMNNFKSGLKRETLDLVLHVRRR